MCPGLRAPEASRTSTTTACGRIEATVSDCVSVARGTIDRCAGLMRRRRLRYRHRRIAPLHNRRLQVQPPSRVFRDAADSPAETRRRRSGRFYDETLECCIACRAISRTRLGSARRRTAGISHFHRRRCPYRPRHRTAQRTGTRPRSSSRQTASLPSLRRGG